MTDLPTLRQAPRFYIRRGSNAPAVEARFMDETTIDSDGEQVSIYDLDITHVSLDGVEWTALEDVI